MCSITKRRAPLWQLIPSEPGYYLKSVGAENEQAIEYFNDRIGTFSLHDGENFLFNFYELNLSSAGLRLSSAGSDSFAP